MQDIMKKTQNIIADYLGYNEEILPQMNLVTDLGLNSFDVASLICEFEDQFYIVIPTEDIMKLITVQSLVDYICDLVSVPSV